MSDGPGPEKPAGDPLSEVGSESDIDALLAGAADLAAGLNEQVGGPDGSGAAPSPDLDAPSAGTPPESVIDDELDQIDLLLEQACQELGSGDDDAAAEDDASGGQSHSTNELAEAPAPVVEVATDAEWEAADTADDSEEPPGFTDVAESDDEAGVDDPPAFEDAPDSEAQPDPPLDAWDACSGAEGTGDDLEPAGCGVSGVVDTALGLLDALDRPFGWLGYGPRVAIGWIALLTLFAAVCVFVISRWA